MVCCMKLICSFGHALNVHVAFDGCGFFIIFACPPQSVTWIYSSFHMLVCVVLIIWIRTILIKICSVFSFLISLVADPSYPLYLIVSCGKFLVFRASFSFPLIHLFSN